MPKYQVVATRTTVYEVEAPDSNTAITQMIDGAAQEVDEITESIDGVVLCPVCDQPLNDSTTRTITEEGETREEPTYCDTCDREVLNELGHACD